MKLIDSHCHLDFEQFSQDREQVLQAAHQQGVTDMVLPGVQSSRWDSLINLCQATAGLHYGLGLHPLFIDQHQRQDIELLRTYLAQYTPCAVGEIGLDFYDRNLSIDKQIAVFEAQLAVALEFDLPVILHVRKAHEDILNLLRKYPVQGGIVHAFNGSLNQAQRYQAHGFKFGFGGMLTYPRSRRLRELAQQLPLETIVLETDSPDMTVQQHKGTRNSPAYLSYCVQALAELRQMSASQLAAITRQNTIDVLRLTVRTE